ncbi:type II toxin-antitoxin system RelE/ParE family toxin [Novosphingobium sp.]|uniref:type II toxin-antitoxin system RelE family toxin n=1 Tax=Novosphingobium sp. TaxID=1874826 RepID=UPI00286E34A5|nr:type II toxin-antitoxin system RelE/ParE family toxin [Novosphingobium sp.]
MEVRYSRKALKSLLRSNKRQLIERKINELAKGSLAANPNVKKLVGREEYRLRVQDWRVIFCIDGSIFAIEHIGPRGSVYEE